MITIEVKNTAVLQALSKVQKELADMSAVMADLAQILASESELQFAQERGPVHPWSKLSEESTIPMRQRRGTWPGKMLQVSGGGLAASVQTDYGSHFASIGSNKAYAAMQFFGGTTSPKSMMPGKTIPARPFLPLDPESGKLSQSAEQSMLDVLGSWLDDITNQ